MTRLMLLVTLGVVSMAYFPESRAVLLDTAEPVITPPLRWHTSHEMEQVVRELRFHEREDYGDLPDPRRFHDWLISTLDFGGATDAWDNPYVLHEKPDSFVVVSPGPDGLPDTEDDVRMAAVRSRTGRR